MKSITWQWPAPDSLNIKLPSGFHFRQLRESEISKLCNLLKIWYPDIVTGMESVHLDAQFYLDNASLEEGPDRNLLPLVICSDENIVAFISLEKNSRAFHITSRMGVVSPDARGLGLAHLGPAILEAYGRAMNAGLVFYFATLRIPHQQVAAEKSGFSLVGIVPAFDLDTLEPTKPPKRVPEAIYAKVLCSPDDCFVPDRSALTEKTRQLWDVLF